MYQRSLLDDGLTEPGRAVVGILGGAPSLTRAQKKFRQLIERLTLQREELARWREFDRSYHQQLADRLQPALKRLREKQAAMVRFLDQAHAGTALGKRERAKVRDILGGLLSDLLAESQDPELVRIHDKYADKSFDEEQQVHLEAMRTLASEALASTSGFTPAGRLPRIWPRGSKINSVRAVPIRGNRHRARSLPRSSPARPDGTRPSKAVPGRCARCFANS